MAGAYLHWALLSRECRKKWKCAADMRKELGLSQNRAMAAWHGRSVGSGPLLLICHFTGMDPMTLLDGED